MNLFNTWGEIAAKINVFFCRTMKVNVKHFIAYEKKVYVYSILVGFFLVFVVFSFADLLSTPLLRISFYNVGQGDSIFIQTPEHVQVLIDGGVNATVLEKLAKDMPLYDRSIDLVIATHPNADHISGLVDVLERYRVNSLFLPRIQNNTLAYQKLLRAALKNHVAVKETWGVENISLDKGINFKILNPLRGEQYKNDNDFGIVGFLTYGKFQALFTADISQEKEEKIMKFLPRNITVLKVAHHGSRYSSSFNFLNYIHPQISIIQVGKNNYGHPAKETLDKLKSIGSSMLRTDRDGDIEIFSDGNTYWIE